LRPPQLPLEERADLARELIASLDGPSDPDAEASWAAELQRRLDDLRTGRVSAVAWPDAEQRILERLRRVRPR
jgi:putative addiction module component (TIGR02574 family)